MDWTQFATFLIANILFSLTLWLWNRAESRADMRQMDAKMEMNTETGKGTEYVLAIRIH